MKVSSALFLSLLPLIGSDTTRDIHLVPGAAVPVRLENAGKHMEPLIQEIISKQLKLSGDTLASAPLADDLAFFSQTSYHQNGYPEAHVEWQVDGDTIILTADEGAAYEVGDLEITGVDAELKKELLPYLTSATKGRRAGGAKHLPFVESELKEGAEMVQRRLQADGYLEATAGLPTFTPAPSTKSMAVSVEVKLGEKHVFGQVALSGDLEWITPETRDKLVQLTGKPFNEVTLESLRKEMVGECQMHGFFAPTITAKHNWQEHSGTEIMAQITVSAGELFRITDLQVSPDFGRGAGRVASAVFHSSINGNYTPAALDLFTRRALDTGIYGRLNVSPEISAPGELILKIDGTEAKPKTLGVFGGFESFAGPMLGIEARNVNFLDSGNTASVKAEWSARGLEGRVGWIDPAILDSRNALSVDLSAETFSFKAYDRKTAAVRASLSRRFSRKISAEIFSGFSLNQSTSADLLPSELGPETYSIANLGGRMIFDYRDNPLIPHRGWLANFSVEADTGEVSFARLDLSAAYYHPLTQHWRFALGARSSVIQSDGDISKLPIDLRNFNGGATTVRSFNDREIGAQSVKGGTPLGDFAASSLNAELSYEIISNLEIAAFADAGSLGDAQSIFSFNNLRYALGLGIRYNLPIGPLRIDYGINPNPELHESSGALHVTFGFAF